MGYFKPPRRKVGVAVLVLACVFAAGWIRSRVVADVLVIQSTRDRWSVASVNNNISFHFYKWNALSVAGEEWASDCGWRYHHTTDLSRATKKWSNVIRSEQDRVWSFAGMTYARRTAEQMGEKVNHERQSMHRSHLPMRTHDGLLQTIATEDRRDHTPARLHLRGTMDQKLLHS